jgi:hypothetical protein
LYGARSSADMEHYSPRRESCDDQAKIGRQFDSETENIKFTESNGNQNWNSLRQAKCLQNSVQKLLSEQ